MNSEPTFEMLLTLFSQQKQSPAQSMLLEINRRNFQSKLEADFRRFVEAAWPIVVPNTTFQGGIHVDAICDYLQAVTEGKIKRLIINIPPREGKSTLVSVLWPIWSWARDGGKSKWIHWSYGLKLSMRDSMARRRLLRSNLFKLHWAGKCDLAPDPVRQDVFYTEQLGYSMVVATGGGTGEGGDYVVVDDPHSADGARSDADRSAAVLFARETLFTRLNDKTNGSIVVIMQRLNEADLTGVLLKDKGWTHLCLPAIAEKDEDIALPSGRIIHRTASSLLDPARLGVPVLAQLKIDIGTYAFNGQYQQRPAPAEGGIFKKDWWQSYDAPPSFDIMCLSLDATFKDNVDSDYVCIQVWGFIGPRAYLVDRIHDRLSYVATRDAFERMILKYPEAHARLVEDKANGSAIISELSLKYTGIIAINPEGGKVSRAHAVSPDVEAHNVYLPKTAWAQDVIDEAAAFPNAANDDDVDAMTQALNWRRQHRLGLGLVYQWQSSWLYDDDHRPIALYGNGGFEQHIVGVSSGIRSPTSFIEAMDDGTDLWASREHYYDPAMRMKTEKETADDLDAFIAGSKVTSPRPMIVVTPSSTLVPELVERGYWVVEGSENELDGIRRLSVAMQSGHLRVNKECVNLIRELSLFSWSDKKDEPKRENDSTPNALRQVGERVLFDWRLS